MSMEEILHDLLQDRFVWTARYLKVALKADTLVGAYLTDKNLMGANLEGEDLSRTRFLRADLRCADFRGANLSNAQLLFVKMEHADLSGANLAGTNLESTEGLTPEMLASSKGLETAILPRGMTLTDIEKAREDIEEAALRRERVRQERIENMVAQGFPDAHSTGPA